MDKDTRYQVGRRRNQASACSGHKLQELTKNFQVHKEQENVIHDQKKRTRDRAFKKPPVLGTIDQDSKTTITPLSKELEQIICKDPK